MKSLRGFVLWKEQSYLEGAWLFMWPNASCVPRIPRSTNHTRRSKKMPTTAVLSPASRLRELEKKRFHADRKGRIPVMDAETLRELCLDNDGYETPELNDNLYVRM